MCDLSGGIAIFLRVPGRLATIASDRLARSLFLVRRLLVNLAENPPQFGVRPIRFAQQAKRQGGQEVAQIVAQLPGDPFRLGQDPISLDRWSAAALPTSC